MAKPLAAYFFRKPETGPLPNEPINVTSCFLFVPFLMSKFDRKNITWGQVGFVGRSFALLSPTLFSLYFM